MPETPNALPSDLEPWQHPGWLLEIQLAHRQNTCLKCINRVGRKGKGIQKKDLNPTFLHKY